MLHEGRVCVARRCSAQLLLLISTLGLFAWAAPASALDPKDVPAPLQPWVPWVLEELGDSVCPKLDGEPVCVWPGRLELELNAKGGHFRLNVQLDRQGRLPLPGGDEQWPQDVMVDGKAAVVLADDEVPVVVLAAGQHTLQGSFVWTSLPETLVVPGRIALLQLGVNGRRVPQPRRADGRVWLTDEQDSEEEPESLTLEVFRKLEDEVPFAVQTLLVLQVSGRSRELRLPTALTAGALPIQLEAELPARVEPNGELRLQVYAGEHQLTLTALYPKPPERLGAPRHAPPGPASEIWVFVPHTEQRQVEVKGGTSIDPQRTNLPAPWRSSAAYQLEGGSELTFETLQRGQPQPQPNRLSLERELWLDLDGRGYTVRDRLGGSMERGWRLDLLQGVLGHANANGQDQLITTHPASGVRGVELRQGGLNLSAEWRLDEARTELPAVAWSENVDQLGTSLYLPPGWQLLSVSGADSVSESWLARWDLFALFFVLVVAVAVAKLDRWAWGALALLALLLAHGEPHAPQFTWVAILLCIALLQGLPAGRFRQLIRGSALAVSLLLLGTTLSFTISQIRAALYPQVVDDGGSFDLPYPGTRSAPMAEPISEKPMAPEEAASAPAMAAPVPPPSPTPTGQGIGAARDKRYSGDALSGVLGGGVSGSMTSSKGAPPRSTLLEQDPHAQIQTGPGVPSWSWRSWRLGWSGPVEHTHMLELTLLSPGASAALSALRILSLGLLAFWALRKVWTRARPAVGAGSAALLVLALGSLFSAPARAELPTTELLEQLKERIETPAPCEDDCLQVPRLAIDVSASEVRLNAEVHAAARAEYQLPGPVSHWGPATVEVDGKPATALLLADDGYLHVRLDPGVHRVSARGPIAGRQLNLDPGTAARWVTVNARGWEVSGLSESGEIDGSLAFVRPLEPEGVQVQEASATLPSWSQLTRTFSFAVTWTVSTELKRSSPKGTLVMARIPLLPGERVTSADVPVENGVATVRLTGDTDSWSFDSVIEPRPELMLRAAEGAGYSERWVLRCGPIFRCDAQGLAPLQHTANGHWEPVFAPWPGETLSLAVVRPTAAAGQTATIDRARLELHPGVRLLRAELSAHVRSSTQTSYALGLPEGSEVDRLSVNGRAEPIRQQGSQLELVLPPGEHELNVGWQERGGLSAWFRTPRVLLGRELINAELSVHLPDERWLLAAGGPSWGPAILFWGHLVLVLLLAPLLARIPRSPLRAWQWALLALGLTQVPLPVAGFVFGWFFLMAFQDLVQPQRRWLVALRTLLLLGSTLAFLGCLFGAVYDSLLNTPDMEVAGAGSSERLLHWYVDRSAGALPEAWVLSLSLWVWRGVMLLWALWLANSLIAWLKWAWQRFSAPAT